MNVKWYENKFQLCEGVGKTVQMSFCSADDEQCHPWVYCKDYLQDAIYCTMNNKESCVHGFIFKPSTMPKLCMDKARILVCNLHDTAFASKIDAALEFLNQIEDVLKMPHSIYTKVDNAKPKRAANGVFLIEGNKRWLASPPMISLYSYLIRCSFKHTKGNKYADTLKGTTYYSNDKYSLPNAREAIKYIAKLNDEVIFYSDTQKNYPASASIETMHHSSGMMAFMNGETQDNFKHWHRKELQKAKT